MKIKEFFSRIYTGRRAQSALELSVGGMVLAALIGATVSQGWGFSFANYNSFRALRQSLTYSYKYSYGVFGPGEEGVAALFNPYEGGRDGTGYSGSASRLNASVVIVEDRLSPSDLGKFGALNRSPLMVQSSGAMTPNMFMPQTERLDYNLPRVDFFINGVHFPFKVADFREVNVYRPGNREIGLGGPSPFWEKYCLYATNFDTIMILDAGGNVNPWFVQGGNLLRLPFYDVTGQEVIDENGNYVGPIVSDSGEPVPLPLYGFVGKQWSSTYEAFGIRFLEIAKYPNAPWVGCMTFYAREYNQSNESPRRKWCDGIANLDSFASGNECGFTCAGNRFDLDLSDQMEQEEPEPPMKSNRVCSSQGDVSANLRPFFFWQWFPVMGVVDDKEDDNNGTFGVKEGVHLRYGMPMKSHDYLDVPANSVYGYETGEERIAGDRDLEEEQVMRFLKVDKNFGVIHKILVQDMQAGDFNFSANDDDEVGLYFGKDIDQDGHITTRSPLSMQSEVQDGTFMSVEDTPTQVITKRKKQKVDLIQRIIKLSPGATFQRWCGRYVDGEKNPVERCGNCKSDANRLKTCFEPWDLDIDGGAPAIYVRTMIADRRGQLMVADK